MNNVLVSTTAKQAARSRAWLGSLRQWHWVSSAVCLVGMLLFALTGITLNHAGQIESAPEVITLERTAPERVLTAARGYVAEDDFAVTTPLPPDLENWLEDNLPVHVAGREADWTDIDIYLAMARPGGDAWLSVDLETGDVVYERIDRGWISYFNDLHKGRNTGRAWSWFIDVFSVACVVFCITGLLLLKRYSRARPATWPAVGLGFVVPALLALLFIHQ